MEKIQTLIIKEVGFIQELSRNLFRLKRAAKRTDNINEQYDIKEYINRILESMIYLEEMNNYTEQIEQLKEETKTTETIQTNNRRDSSIPGIPFRCIRANKILIHYLTIVDLPAS